MVEAGQTLVEAVPAVVKAVRTSVEAVLITVRVVQAFMEAGPHQVTTQVKYGDWLRL